MARKAKEGTNEFVAFDPDLVRDLIGRIQDCETELESERGSYMKRCRDIRASISGIYTEATARGVPANALKKFVTTRKQLAKATAIIEDLQKEQRRQVKLIAEAFGEAVDLPLFSAALKAAGGLPDDEPAPEPEPEPEPETDAPGEVDNGAERLAGMKKPRNRKKAKAADDGAPADATLN